MKGPRVGRLGIWVSGVRVVACALMLCVGVLAGSVSVASAGTISTFAGGGMPSGQATSLGQRPAAVAVGPDGTLYVADGRSSTVRAVSPAGQETTLAGNGTAGFRGDGGPATTAELDHPDGIAVDTHGNVLIADNANNRVRMVAASTCSSSCAYGLARTTKSDIYTIAGNGTAGFSADGSAATAAELNGALGLWVDAHGNLLIADLSSVRVLAASSCSSGCAYGLGATDANAVYTIAGTATPGYGGDSGAATAAQLQHPSGITVDGAGNVLIADSGNDRVRLVTETDCSSSCAVYNLSSTTPGDIYTISGGTSGSFSDGTNAAGADLSDPTGVWVDSGGNVLIADTGEQKVALIAASDCFTGPCAYGLSTTLTNRIYTIAGNGSPGYSGDDIAATTAELNEPSGVTVDPAGNVLIADTLNNRVRLVAETMCLSSSCEYGLGSAAPGDIYTIAGNGSPGSSGDAGPASAAGLASPGGVAVDATTGDVVIADTSDNSVRLIAGKSCSSGCEFGLPSTVKGDVYTIAGTGTPGYSGQNGPGTDAELDGPTGVSVDSAGDVLIADSDNNRVRLVAATGCQSSCAYGLPAPTTAGDIYTIAGNGTPGLSGDTGSGASAELDGPQGVAVDGTGNVLIADSDNNRVRLVAAAGCSSNCGYGLPATTAGDIYTIAGNGTGGYSSDGVPATSSELDFPEAVAVNRATGDVVIADTANGRVRLIASATCTNNCAYGESTTGGDIYTIAGDGTQGFSDGTGSATGAEVHFPAGVAVDGAGDVLIGDTDNNRVRMVSASGCTNNCPYGLPATTAGDIYTIAGNGTAGYAGDGDQATDAELDAPEGVALDTDGDALIADSANNRVRVVSQTATSLTAPASAVTNQTVTLTATVTAPSGASAPAGTVSFNNNDTPIPGCSAQALSSSPPYTATCQTSFTASSSPETLNAIFTPSGSAPDGSESTFSDLTIGKDSTTTTTTFTSGQSLTFTATVKPKDAGPAEPTGTVEFIDGTTPVASCSQQPLTVGSSGSTTTCTVSGPGSRSITVQYGGDTNFAGSTSPGQTAVIGASPVNVTLPQITGTPKVGDTLTATTGNWTGEPTSFLFVWEDCPEDDADPGACDQADATPSGNPKFTLTQADAGHVIRVVVIATNADGVGKATSDPTATVAAPLNITTGSATTDGTTVSLPAHCASVGESTLNPDCVVLFILTILGGGAAPAHDAADSARSQPIAHDAKQRRTVVVGSRRVKIPAGHRETIRITLNRTGRRLLAKHHKLKVKLTITEGRHTVSSRAITFKAKRPSKHEHH
jgi:hypothetical protein